MTYDTEIPRSNDDTPNTTWYGTYDIEPCPGLEVDTKPADRDVDTQ